MLSSIKSLVSRRIRAAAMAVALASTALTAGTAQAEEAAPGSAYTLSFGTDYTSHFISYGADVWGGGDQFSPFSAKSTAFTYGTLSAALGKMGDDVSFTGFVNVWADINNNVESGIGGSVQEIDVNVGVTAAFGNFSVTLANGLWCYAGDEEKIADLTVAYSDGDSIIKGFALNPSVTLHYRYDGNGGQETGLVIVPGIKPSIKIGDGTYAPTLAFPIAAGIFTDDGFQGGDSGFGFFNAGVAVSVPLAFVPAQFGTWTLSASATYWYTAEDQIPNNPEENFVVTAVSLGLAF